MVALFSLNRTALKPCCGFFQDIIFLRKYTIENRVHGEFLKYYLIISSDLQGLLKNLNWENADIASNS